MAHRKDPPKRRRRRFHMRWCRLVWFLVFIGIIIPVAGFAWGGFRAESDLHQLKQDYHAHDFVGLASSVRRLGGTLAAMHTEAYLLGWLDAIPVVRGYYLNGMDLLTAASNDLQVIGQVVPPVLKAAEAPGSSAQKSQAVSQAVTTAGETMSSLVPEVKAANASIQRMDPYRMPAFLENKGLQVSSLQSMSDTFLKLLPTMTGPHPILASLLGLPNPKLYLLIFQNSGELRATGGFMTAYAFVPFTDGKLGKITSQNIQQLDTKVTYHPTQPIIITYLPVQYWHLRDANTAMPGPGAAVPDVPEAVSNIYRFYDSIPGVPHVSGVEFINTWFVDQLIGDVGGLNVPTVHGKVVHLTEQNANYEMEYMAEGLALPANVRKLFIGTMMKELMHDVFHGHMSQLLKVAGTVGEGLSHEQVLLYFNNPAAERFVTQENWGGVVPKQVNGDYVEVVDENLLGHKDNYWMHESYSVNITTESNGQNLETVKIHWEEPAISVPEPPYLVVPYHTWVTVMAPSGSSLISMTGTASGGNGAGGGIDSYIETTDDTALNKEEFGGHMNLPARTAKSQPPARGTVVTKFWLPSGVNIHRILVQKQPGMRTEPVTVTVNGVTQQIQLTSRTWLTF